MSKHLVRAATDPDPYGWRAGTVRVLANAMLVLLVFEVVSLVVTVVAVVAGEPPHLTVVELLFVVAVFVLFRWVFVLPALLLVLVGIEFVARRAPYARALTAIVAFAPMIAWELTKSPSDFPSVQGAVLGVTAVLFAIVARLPARFRRSSTEESGAAQPPADPAIAPR